MDKKTKIEIIKMLIPLLGIWWILNRILNFDRKISWWDFGKWPSITVGIISIYQYVLYLLLKYCVLI